MKILKFAMATLLAGLTGAAIADEYQDAIGRAFSGFQILAPSEIRLNKGEMRQELYERAKDQPALIVGDFNSDKRKDFAALIRGTTKKILPEDRLSKRPAIDYYDGYLVICLGRSQGGYDCRNMQANPLRILIPHNAYLVKIAPHRQRCLQSEKFRAPKPKVGFDPDQEAPAPEGFVTLKTDGIGFFTTSGVGDQIYIPQDNGQYLLCTISD
jgi:hypothetical protein